MIAPQVKTNVVRDLALDLDFALDFPLVIANVIHVRKTTKSITFLREWWDACRTPRWIDPFQYGELDSSFRWSTPEQGILSVLIANWVLQGRLPLTFPRIEGRHHASTASDFEYLNTLSSRIARTIHQHA